MILFGMMFNKFFMRIFLVKTRNLMILKFCVSCKLNNEVEVKLYKIENDLCELLEFFNDEDFFYVHVAGKMICNIIRENLSSRHDISFTPDIKTKNLRIKFVWLYDNMTYRYYMQQSRPMVESKMVKHVKNMSEEEKLKNFLITI